MGNNTFACIAYGTRFVYIRLKVISKYPQICSFKSGASAARAQKVVGEMQCGSSISSSSWTLSSSGERSLESNDDDTLKSLIGSAAMSLGYKELKDEQTLSIMEFVKGKDVFVSLPTGFGKSLCYILLPIVFDRLRKVDKKSIALVVSPLIALMQDQVSAATAMGVSAIHITDKHATKLIVKQSVKNGEYQIVFISPEALVGGMEWRSMLATDIYANNLVAFVIDEAHCIKKWYVIYYN